MSNRPEYDLNEVKHGIVAAFLSKLLGSLGEAGLTKGMLETLLKDRERLGCGVIAFVDAVKKFAHVINCDAKPKEHRGMAVYSHSQSGLLRWNPKQLSLYLSDRQKGENRIKVTDLHQEVRGMNVLNGCVLDYLMENKFLIPSEWKKDGWVFFWGTIYKRTLAEIPDIHDIYVRGLGWDSVNDRWEGVSYCFDTTADAGCRAAILEAT